MKNKRYKNVPEKENAKKKKAKKENAPFTGRILLNHTSIRKLRLTS